MAYARVITITITHRLPPAGRCIILAALESAPSGVPVAGWEVMDAAWEALGVRTDLCSCHDELTRAGGASGLRATRQLAGKGG